MDYKRFLELVERFFDRAGTTLHKKGEDYGFSGDAPSFVLIDENRNAYYLLEMAFPPDIPHVDRYLLGAVETYAANNGISSDAVKAFSVLGEDIRIVKANPVDDDAINTQTLQQKYALVAADSVVTDIDRLLQEMGIEHQSVPLKGIFTIYFFNNDAAEVLEGFYERVSNTDVPEERIAAAAITTEDELADALPEEPIEETLEATEEVEEPLDFAADDIEQIEDEEIDEDEAEELPEELLAAEVSEDSEDVEDLGVEVVEEVEDVVSASVTADEPPRHFVPPLQGGELVNDEVSELDNVEDQPLLEDIYVPEEESEPEAIALEEEEIVEEEPSIEELVEIEPKEEPLTQPSSSRGEGADLSIEPEPIIDEVAIDEVLAEVEPEIEVEPELESPAHAWIADQVRNDEIIEIDEIVEPEPKIVPATTVVAKEEPKAAPTVKVNWWDTIWGLFLYTPARLLRIVTSRRIPAAIAYWLSGMLVLFGLYSIPVGFATNSFVDSIVAKNMQTLEAAQSLFSRMDGSSISSIGLGIFAFDLSLLNFIFSHYMLQYILAAAYLLAIFPMWRAFALKTIRIIIISLIFYIPAVLAGGSGVRALTAHADKALMQSGTVNALAAASTAEVGVLLIALLIPIIVLIFACSATAPEGE
ncbi:MAG: hypothetical protein LBV09_02265 [Deferribacteraceae bacterium]|jgi:hypothetical protein|nr:hypothetical protein [Deferribacteraceae bacterium]